MPLYFLICFLLITQTAAAEVRESLNYTYYIANAKPSSSIKTALNASSPIRENGQIYHGYTKWYVKWNYRWQASPDGNCRITKVNTDVTGTVTLPKLLGANSDQESQFNRYVAALRLHEQGHYNLGKEAAYEIDSRILNLPLMPSCQVLESAANDLGYQTLDEYKGRERQYDATTEHGKSQGAWLER